MTVLTVIVSRVLLRARLRHSIYLVSISVSYSRFLLLVASAPVHRSLNTLLDLLSLSAHRVDVAPGLASSRFSGGYLVPTPVVPRTELVTWPQDGKLAMTVVVSSFY